MIAELVLQNISTRLLASFQLQQIKILTLSTYLLVSVSTETN